MIQQLQGSDHTAVSLGPIRKEWPPCGGLYSAYSRMIQVSLSCIAQLKGTWCSPPEFQTRVGGLDSFSITARFPRPWSLNTDVFCRQQYLKTNLIAPIDFVADDMGQRQKRADIRRHRTNNEHGQSGEARQRDDVRRMRKDFFQLGGRRFTQLQQVSLTFTPLLIP